MLLTEFFTVGTAGATVDGREIEEQWLIDADEAYDTEIFTAVINGEHESWWGNLGLVHATRLGKNKEGKTTLEAQLRPNNRLIQFNMAGQKLFTSMEINPSFADTGKAYLTGLAVTDNPASLSTSMLQLFSTKKKESSFSMPTEFSLGVDSGEIPSPDTEEVKTLLTRLLSSLGITDKKQTHFKNTDQEEIEMTPEELKEFQDQQKAQSDSITKLTESVTALTGQVTKLSAKPESDDNDDDDKENPMTLSQVSEQLDASKIELTALKDELKELKEEVPGKFKNGNDGDADKEEAFV